jgi:membrane protein
VVAAPPEDSTRRLIDTASAHLPPWLAGWVERAFSQWPGRVLTGSASGFVRIEIFDRSMTIAAQFFTSIFPILLMTATFLGPEDTQAVGDAMKLPDQTQSVLDQVVEGSPDASFGLAGAVIVLASATSLSRALTRAYAAIWLLPRPTARITSAWRWLAALLALAIALVLTFTLTRQLAGQPPRGLFGMLLAAAVDVAMGMFVPWVLLARRVPPRRLLPGAVLLAVALLVVRPGIAAWMPHALAVSANRYGSIGVAFTYLACLYTISFCWLGASVIGQVVVSDEGAFGRWLRGDARPAKA